MILPKSFGLGWLPRPSAALTHEQFCQKVAHYCAHSLAARTPFKGNWWLAAHQRGPKPRIRYQWARFER